jgi:hypothetical protein
MLLRSWLLYYRRRLILAAVLSLAGAVLALFITSAESFTDFGVLWHHFCNCPLHPRDIRGVWLIFAMVTVAIGFTLSIGKGVSRTASSGSNVLFFLTRPVSRVTVFFFPVVLATIVMAVFPVLATLLLLGWLKLVHAPALGHLVAIMEQIPAASRLGAHPSVLSFLSAIEFPRRYLAAISVGLCFYVWIDSSRWVMLSSNSWVRFCNPLSSLWFLYFPLSSLMGKSHEDLLFLTPTRSASLTYVPSTLSIALHFCVAAAILYGCWRVLRTAEL